ncbi:MAG: FadR/GntR family transcriptional regulator [Sedimentisphaerales bacterium]
MKTAGTVATKLRQFIVDRKLPPGATLPTHAELCGQLGVGSRPLREGLSILSQQGLIETRRKGGTKVQSLSIANLSELVSWHLAQKGYLFEQIVRARAALESSIAAEAAIERKARDLLLILDAIEQLEESDAPGDKNLYIRIKADEAVHLAILKATHNPVLMIIGEVIAAQFKSKMQERLQYLSERLAVKASEHRAIYMAIEKQDAETARVEMYKHVMNQLDEKSR